MLILDGLLWFLGRKSLPSFRIEECVVEKGVVDSRGWFVGKVLSLSFFCKTLWIAQNVFLLPQQSSRIDARTK